MRKPLQNPLQSLFQTLTIFLLAALPTALLAQAPAGNIAETWVFTVKNGHQAEFEAAFREQGALREKHNDPRRWEVYIPNTGSDLNRYLLRTCCFAWADQDSYSTWTMQNGPVMEQWYSKVDQHVETAAHYFYEMDFANSHWPEQGSAAALVGVTEFSIAAGKVSQFHSARAELSQIALNQGWSAGGKVWAWSDRIGGEPSAALVVPFSNYAAMAPSDQQFASFLAEKMGSDKAAALMEKVSSSVDSSRYSIWMHRPDLSSSKD